jgi:20S proteasome alpha/beta subunit
LTLVVCYKGVNGLVFAADSRGTIGDPRGLTAITDSMVKLFQLSNYVGIMTYGQAELAAQLIQEIKRTLSEEDIYLTPEFLEKVRNTLRTKYSDWFRGVPHERRPAVGFIIGGFEDGEAKIYYLTSALDFAPQLDVKGHALGGIPQYATYLTHRLYNPKMTLDDLVKLAVFVISETATQDPKVGGPIRVAVILREEGYKELDESYVNKVIKENERAHEELRKFFFGGEVHG